MPCTCGTCAVSPLRNDVALGLRLTKADELCPALLACPLGANDTLMGLVGSKACSSDSSCTSPTEKRRRSPRSGDACGSLLGTLRGTSSSSSPSRSPAAVDAKSDAGAASTAAGLTSVCHSPARTSKVGHQRMAGTRDAVVQKDDSRAKHGNESVQESDSVLGLNANELPSIRKMVVEHPEADSFVTAASAGNTKGEREQTAHEFASRDSPMADLDASTSFTSNEIGVPAAVKPPSSASMKNLLTDPAPWERGPSVEGTDLLQPEDALEQPRSPSLSSNLLPDDIRGFQTWIATSDPAFLGPYPESSPPGSPAPLSPSPAHSSSSSSPRLSDLPFNAEGESDNSEHSPRRFVCSPRSLCKDMSPLLEATKSGDYMDRFYQSRRDHRARDFFVRRTIWDQQERDETFGPECIAFSGYLLKQGSFMKTWKKRFFILRKDRSILSYYYSREQLVKVGELPIYENDVVTWDQTCAERPFRILYQGRNRKLLLDADDGGEELCMAWIRQLNQAVLRRRLAVASDRLSLLSASPSRSEGQHPLQRSNTSPVSGFLSHVAGAGGRTSHRRGAEEGVAEVRVLGEDEDGEQDRIDDGSDSSKAGEGGQPEDESYSLASESNARPKASHRKKSRVRTKKFAEESNSQGLGSPLSSGSLPSSPDNSGCEKRCGFVAQPHHGSSGVTASSGLSCLSARPAGANGERAAKEGGPASSGGGSVLRRMRKKGKRMVKLHRQLDGRERERDEGGNRMARSSHSSSVSSNSSSGSSNGSTRRLMGRKGKRDFISSLRPSMSPSRSPSSSSSPPPPSPPLPSLGSSSTATSTSTSSSSSFMWPTSSSSSSSLASSFSKVDARAVEEQLASIADEVLAHSTLAASEGATRTQRGLSCEWHGPSLASPSSSSRGGPEDGRLGLSHSPSHLTSASSMDLYRSQLSSKWTRESQLGDWKGRGVPTFSLNILVTLNEVLEYKLGRTGVFVVMSTLVGGEDGVEATEKVELSRTEVQGYGDNGKRFINTRTFMTLLSLGSDLNRELFFDVYAATRSKSEAIAGQQLIGEAAIRAGSILRGRDRRVELPLNLSDRYEGEGRLVIAALYTQAAIDSPDLCIYAAQNYAALTACEGGRRMGLKRRWTIGLGEDMEKLGQMAAGGELEPHGTYKDEMYTHLLGSSSMQPGIIIQESLSAFRYSLSIPIAYIDMLLARYAGVIDHFQQIEAKLKSCIVKQVKKSGDKKVNPKSEVVRSYAEVQLKLKHYQNLIDEYDTCKMHYEMVQEEIDSSGGSSSRENVYNYVKPSTKKKDMLLRFLPTNLGLQLMSVSGTGAAGGKDGFGAGGAQRSFAIVTHGCAAAHVYGYSRRGIRKLLAEHRKLSSKSQGARKSTGELDEQDLILHEIERRRDVVNCQILSVAVSAFLSRLSLATTSRVLRTSLRRTAKIGFLLDVESVLSTLGKEMTMLEDLDAGVKWLNKVSFHVLQTNFAEEGSRCVAVVEDELTGDVRCSLAVSNTLFQILPEEVQEGQPVPIVAVLFNQGINERQSVAKYVSNKAELQADINMESVVVLQRYFNKYENFVREDVARRQFEKHNHYRGNVVEKGAARSAAGTTNTSSLTTTATSIAGTTASTTATTMSTTTLATTKSWTSRNRDHRDKKHAHVHPRSPTETYHAGLSMEDRAKLEARKEKAGLEPTLGLGLGSSQRPEETTTEEAVDKYIESMRSELDTASTAPASAAVAAPYYTQMQGACGSTSAFSSSSSSLPSPPDSKMAKRGVRGQDGAQRCGAGPRGAPGAGETPLGVNSEPSLRGRAFLRSSFTPDLEMVDSGETGRSTGYCLKDRDHGYLQQAWADSERVSGPSSPSFARASAAAAAAAVATSTSLSPTPTTATATTSPTVEAGAEGGPRGGLDTQAPGPAGVLPSRQSSLGSTGGVVVAGAAQPSRGPPRMHKRGSMVPVGSGRPLHESALAAAESAERPSLLLQNIVEVKESLKRLAEMIATNREKKSGEKNVQILLQSSDICRRLGAARTTCCKSGKDRTAMAVTLEQSRVTVETFHCLRGISLCQAMRTCGVRRQNVELNTGQNKYAFNAVQVKFFPLCYRPPRRTMCASVET